MPEFSLEASQAEQIRAAIGREGVSFAEFMRGVLAAYLDGNGHSVVRVHEAPRGRGRVSRALGRALRGLEVESKDAGAVELARHYAAILDARPQETKHLGPRLLETLVQLRLTPAARQAVVAGRTARANELRELSGLDRLRICHLIRPFRDIDGGPQLQCVRLDNAPPGSWCESCRAEIGEYAGYDSTRPASARP